MKKLILMSLLFASSVYSSDPSLDIEKIANIEDTVRSLILKRYEKFDYILRSHEFTQARLMLRYGIVSIKNSSEFFREKLFNAVRFNHEDRIEFLLESGVDINAQDNQGYTAIQWAIICGCPLRTIIFLLERRAHVNSQDENGNTPLHHAVCSVRPDPDKEKIIKKLLESGANVHIRNNNEKIALDCARDCTSSLIDLLSYETNKNVVAAFSSLQGARQEPQRMGASSLLIKRLFQMMRNL